MENNKISKQFAKKLLDPINFKQMGLYEEEIENQIRLWNKKGFIEESNIEKARNLQLKYREAYTKEKLNLPPSPIDIFNLYEISYTELKDLLIKKTKENIELLENYNSENSSNYLFVKENLINLVEELKNNY